MLKFAALVLAVLLPLAAAPVAQGSVIDVKGILATDPLGDRVGGVHRVR